MAVGALGVRIAVGKSSFHQTSSGCNCSSRETISGGKTRFRTSHQPPLPPPLPPPPRRHSRNRCPCGECFARPEFNTPGDCSFRAKAAVAVEAVTNAITIDSTNPFPTAAAEIATITINPVDVATAAVSTQNYYCCISPLPSNRPRS